jgi:hypothetical protein
MANTEAAGLASDHQSRGPAMAEVLTLFGPQGERIHVRARPRPD